MCFAYGFELLLLLCINLIFYLKRAMIMRVVDIEIDGVFTYEYSNRGIVTGICL
jgi:hypothetical protein